MARVSCTHVSAFPGYQWHHPGAVVEMADEDAELLLEIAGPEAGYAVVPEKKAPARKAAAPEDDGKSGTEGK